MNNNILCTDIYEEKINDEINWLKRFCEAWQNPPSYLSTELFKFANDDFYFYRFLIDRVEKRKYHLLNNIIYEALSRYNYSFEIPKKIQIDFILNYKTSRIGYTFKDFYEEQDINKSLEYYELNEIYIIRTQHKKYDANKDEKHYLNNNQKISETTIQSFFETYFSRTEYKEFIKYISLYIDGFKRITGYQSIQTLSLMNLSTRKNFEKKILENWDYDNYKYQIIDRNNEEIKKLDIENYDFKLIHKEIKNNYIDNKLYELLIGTENFAESFITSEWLYFSLKEKENFDYTVIVSGYFKSIEQLLHNIVMINVDNNCIISLKNKDDIKNISTVYRVNLKNNTRNLIDLNKSNVKLPKYPYIDFVENNKKYIDNSIGSFEYFLRCNSNIFIKQELSKIVSDMIKCYRIECRNVYFHTHNLHDFSIVEKIRENTIFLYAVLLGCIKNVKDNKDKLGLLIEDNFNKICKEIRELQHFSSNFFFVYENGKEKKMIYDNFNNTMEFSDYGTENYKGLSFFEVDDFSQETYKKLNTQERNKLTYLLTAENIPKRIYCYDINKNMHEVNPDLLNKSDL